MKASFLTRIFDLIAPRQCVVCGQRLAVTESVLCATCHQHLPLTLFERHPYDNDMAKRFWGLIPIERAAALFFYEAQSEQARLIYHLKYYQRRDLGEHIGRITARQCAAYDFFRDIDAIVPVPLSRRRQWQRGYNQSMAIAQGVSQFTGIPIYKKVVRRTRFQQSQTHLTHWQRQSNIKDVFELTNPAMVQDRHLLIIDDIVTTGATITALAEELQKAGNVRFSVLSLGYTKS